MKVAAKVSDYYSIEKGSAIDYVIVNPFEDGEEVPIGDFLLDVEETVVTEPEDFTTADDVETIVTAEEADANDILNSATKINENIAPAIPSTSSPLDDDANVIIDEGSDNLTPHSSKRKRPETWARNIYHNKVLAGSEHVNMKKKLIPGKEAKYEDCHCKYRCIDTISPDQQKVLFNEYRSIKSRVEQRAFLSGLLYESSVQRRTVDEPTVARNRSISYSLRAANGDTFKVCLKFFCNTFGISKKVPLNIVKRKSPSTGVYNGTHRSKGRIAPNLTDERHSKGVTKFLNSVPKLPSHYCRKSSNRLYFEPTLNLTKLYNLYKETVGTASVVSKGVFTRIFKEYEPPLAFFKPKKDQCTTCNIGATDPKYEDHIRRKTEIILAKQNDKAEAKTDPQMVFATFDLQAILVLPYAKDSQLYYKRKLSVFNFTIYDSNGDGICNLYDQTNGGKGSTEVGTYLLQYLKKLHNDGVKKVVFYADTCGGQNRNQYIVAAFFYAVNHPDFCNIECIDLKFMVSGHSYLECDSMHSTIERARKNMTIYNVDEYELVIKMVRKRPFPYVVTRQEFSNFKNLHELAETFMLNRKKDINNKSVQWLKIKWFRFIRDNPIISIKYDIGTEFSQLNIMKSAKIEKTLVDLQLFVLKVAYNQPLLITAAKKRDLLSLIRSGIIPTKYRPFYEHLPTSKTARDEAFWIEETIQEELIDEEDL